MPISELVHSYMQGLKIFHGCSSLFGGSCVCMCLVFLGAFTTLWKATLSCLSICMEQLSSTGWTLMKFDIWGFKNLSRKFRFDSKLTRIMGTVHEVLHTFMIKSCWILLGTWKFQMNVVDEIKTHALCSVTFFQKLSRLWGNVEKIGYSQTGHTWQYNMIHAFCMLST